MTGKPILVLKGRAFSFGDNIDTDVIIPARYLNTLDPDELDIGRITSYTDAT